MNRVQLKAKLDYYNEARGKYRKFFNWNSWPIRQLQKLYDEEIAGLAIDKEFPNDLITKIQNIVSLGYNGGDLTRDVCANIQIQIGNPSRIIPMPQRADKKLDLNERVKSGPMTAKERANRHIQVEDDTPPPQHILPRMSLADHMAAIRSEQSQDDDNDAVAKRPSTNLVNNHEVPSGASSNTLNPESNNLKSARKDARRIFFGNPAIALHRYRNGVYSNIDFSNKGMNLSTDYKPVEIAKPATEVIQETSGTLQAGQYYACFELEKKAGWQPLPSIGINETITAFRADNHQYTIGYCEQSNLHFIKFADPKMGEKVTVEYNLAVEPENQAALDCQVETSGKLFSELSKNDLRSIAKKTPEQQCQILKYFFNEFSRKHDEIVANTSINQQWQDRLANRNGVCRHRATWFMHMAKDLNLPARLVANDLHSFVEVAIDKQWHTVDLGGGDVPEVVEHATDRPYLEVRPIDFEQDRQELDLAIAEFWRSPLKKYTGPDLTFFLNPKAGTSSASQNTTFQGLQRELAAAPASVDDDGEIATHKP